MHSTRDWHQRFLQQASWTRQSRRFVAASLHFDAADRILDVGCGSGVLFQELYEQSSARLHGLDIDKPSLHLAQALFKKSSLVCGDAFRLPYRAAVFDITLCHFLLLWLPDPAAGLAEMARVTRPGGYLCILAEPDYGARIDYPPQFERLGKLQAEVLREQGADPLIGRKLPALLTGAGLESIHVTLIGGHWSGPPHAIDWSSEWSVIATDLQDRLSAAELDALRQQDKLAWKSGERLLYVPTFYAWGRKKH
ncbi:MAG TPA: methyltransferase domain-containing protein [Levilinea sp.]|nr:methyltransferase domain-containing protein [Levilinea sp.]